jgi:hypothetical protein
VEVVSGGGVSVLGFRMIAQTSFMVFGVVFEVAEVRSLGLSFVGFHGAGGSGVFCGFCGRQGSQCERGS